VLEIIVHATARWEIKAYRWGRYADSGGGSYSAAAAMALDTLRKNWMIFYQAKRHIIQVVHLIHGARDIGRLLDG
jgi:hypothetical protein